MTLALHWPLLRRARRTRTQRPFRVAVFTTSYPRDAGDLAGRFVFNTVEHLRERGVDVDVVAPGTYRDFGLTGQPQRRRRRRGEAPPVARSASAPLDGRGVPRRRAPGRSRPCELARRCGDRALQRPPFRRHAARLRHRGALLRPRPRSTRSVARAPPARAGACSHLLLGATGRGDAQLRGEERARDPVRRRRTVAASARRTRRIPCSMPAASRPRRTSA